MTKDQEFELHKLIRKFFMQNKDISAKEMSKFLKNEFAYYNDNELCSESVSNKSIVSDETNKEVNDFWNSLVQQTVDFVNGHKELKDVLLSKQEEISQRWNNDDMKIHIVPDLRMCFSVDELESSLDYGSWHPGTDSTLGFFVGNKCIVNKM